MSKGTVFKCTVFEGAVFKGAADLSNTSEQQGDSAASPSRLAAALGGNGGVGGGDTDIQLPSQKPSVGCNVWLVHEAQKYLLFSLLSTVL